MSEVELVVYEGGIRKVIGTAEVREDGSGLVVSTEITDPEWAAMITSPVVDVSIRKGR